MSTYHSIVFLMVLLGHQTPERTAHELEIEDEIVNLQTAHLCHDVECCNYGKLCWPDVISGKHIFLTAMHLDTWAATIVSLLF